MNHRVRVVVCCLIAFVSSGHAQEIAGRWEGAAQIPGRVLTLTVDLAQESGGSWIGSITIPGLNLNGAALGDITSTGTELSFGLKGVLKGGGFEPPKLRLRVAADGRLTGEFLQAGNSAPVILEKTGPAQVEVPRQSTAIAKEFEGEWKGEYQALGYARTVTLQLANRAEQGASAELVVVGKKVNKLPIDLVTQEGTLLAIDSHETGFTYEGRLQQGEIRGALVQGPLQYPLVLKRAK